MDPLEERITQLEKKLSLLKRVRDLERQVREIETAPYVPYIPIPYVPCPTTNPFKYPVWYGNTTTTSTKVLGNT